MKRPKSKFKGLGPAVSHLVGLKRLERLVKILRRAAAVYAKMQPKELRVQSGEWAGACAAGYHQSAFAHDACGTPACAMGHYAFNTPTRWRWRRGTVLEIFDFNKRERALLDKLYPAMNHQSPGMMHEFRLTYAESCELFSGGGCGRAQTADQAADYIEAFIARKRAALEPARVAIP